jgi:hypothetical protein
MIEDTDLQFTDHRSAINIEQRVAALEETVSTLREIIVALTGGQQAYSAACKPSSPKASGGSIGATAALTRRERRPPAGASVADAVLDEAEAGRQATGGVIHAAFFRAQLSAPGSQV